MVTDEMVEPIAKLIDPEIHEKYDAAYSCKDHTACMNMINRLNLSRERARAVMAALAPVQAEGTYQQRVAAAHGPLFDGDPTDVPERRDRFFEEANETCQAFGMTREEAHQLVDYTYGRPVGEPKAEVGSSALTLTSLCVEAGLDLMECAEADLAKLCQPETIVRIRAKRATRHGRGPLPGLSPAALAATGKTQEGE